MTPDVLARAPAQPRLRRDRLRPAVALDVALFEVRRLVRHPLVLLGVGLYLLVLVQTSDEGPGTAFDVIVTGPTFFVGVFTYFAANLLASRARRDGCTEHHASLPSAPPHRTMGLQLAVLAPAALTLLIELSALTWHGIVTDNLDAWPNAAELASGPLTVIGGGLLGIMIARWLPFPLASIVVMVGVVAVTIWLNNQPETWQMLAPYVSFSIWSESGAWIGRYPGSEQWHAAYLVALCAMAATGALLPEARRKHVVLAVGALFTGAAAVAGVLQLP